MSGKMMTEMLYLLPREELVFERSSNRTVWKQLSIKNPSKTQSVAFKLKNTLPPMFFVRPPTGIVGPNESVTVDIFLQACPPDAAGTQKPPKFLIQATVVTGDIENLSEYWKTLGSDAIWSAKIGCKIVPFKPRVKNVRQEVGGGDPGFPYHKQEDEEVVESMAKLVKQVCVLKEEIDNMRAQSKAFINLAVCVMTIVTVIMAVKYFW